MKPIYQWTDDDDEVAFDAITVGIGGDGAVLEKLGLTVPDTVASIYWPDWISGGDRVRSAMEGPYSIPDALARAEFLCALWAFEHVVISLQDRSLWNDEWGQLAELPGYD